MRIDAHQHFWNYDPVRDSWIDNSMGALKRDFLPSHLREHLQLHKLDGCVAIQADQNEKETEFLLALAENNPLIKGVVGWVNLIDENVTDRLSHFSKNHLLKGVRHILQGEEDDDFMLSESFIEGIGCLNQHGLTYDLLIFPKHLEFANELVNRFPNQPFVIDHLGKPSIKDQFITPWEEQIRAIAQNRNIYCKVSGMVTEAHWSSWTEKDIFPYLDIVFDAFGEDRLMYGSDWPVCNLAGGYSKVYELLDRYMLPMTEVTKKNVWGENASKFYNLST